MGIMQKIKAEFKANKSGAVDVAGLVGAIIVVTVGVLLLPLVQSQITYLTVPSASNDNVTYLSGVASTLAQQIPLFYVLGLMFIALVWAIHSVKGA